MCIRDRPKVVTRQCPGAESNLRLWVTSGLQVRHVTVRLLSHTLTYSMLQMLLTCLVEWLVDWITRRPFTHVSPSNWLVLPIKCFPLVNLYTWAHYWINIHLFKHYTLQISILLTGLTSAQSSAKEPFRTKLPTFGTTSLSQLSNPRHIQPSNVILQEIWANAHEMRESL